MKPHLLPALTLAYIGDAVYELYVRRRLVAAGTCKVGRLHAAATRYVRAGAQAAAMRELMAKLSPEEEVVVRRGRNARAPNVPRGAAPAEYHLATAFEALVGYLYLSGSEERLQMVLESAWQATALDGDQDSD